MEYFATKNDMARVIIQALWNMPELPAKDDRRVKSCDRARGVNKADMIGSYQLAITVLKQQAEQRNKVR